MLTDNTRNKKRKGDDFVRVTAYVPRGSYDKMVSYMIHNAVVNDGKPEFSTYGAISNTITDAINSHCVIGYEYSLLKEEEEEEKDEA